jgi:hypothetical protein
VTCAKCQTQNDRSRRFCRACGHALGQPCRSCGFFNEAADLYCGGCGRGIKLKPGVAAAGDVRVSAPQKSAPASPPAASKGDSRQPSLSASELAELGKRAPPAPTAPLPSKVSQDELDSLFGG